MGSSEPLRGIRHSGAVRNTEPGIQGHNREIPGSRASSRPGMTTAASLLGLAGVFHGLKGLEFDVVEVAVDLLDLADVDVLHDVAGFRIDRDWAARAFPLRPFHGF